MKSFLFAIALAVFGPYGSHANADQDLSVWQELAADLVPYFKPAVKTFSRPVFLFHGTQNTTLEDESYLKAQVAKAFNGIYYESNTAGQGLYLALEHKLASNFGKRIFVLETDPKSFRFLDLSIGGFFLPYQARVVPPGILRRAETLGCHFWKGTDEFGSIKCNNLRRLLFQKLDVSAINYRYVRTSIGHPEEINNHAHTAFVLSSLKGVTKRKVLDGVDLNASLAAFARSLHFSSVQDLETHYYVGLNPQFPAEQVLGMGNTPDLLNLLKKEFKNTVLTHPLSDYTGTWYLFFKVYASRDAVMDLISKPFAQTESHWLNFLAEGIQNSKFDEAEDPLNFKFTSFSHSPGLEESPIPTEMKYVLPSIRVNQVIPGSFPAGPLPSRCQSNIAAYVDELESDPFASYGEKTAADSLKKILKAHGQYAVMFEQVLHLEKDDEATPFFIDAFKSPPCLTTWKAAEKDFGEAGAKIEAQSLNIYMRPSDPLERKKRFYELMQIIQNPTVSSERSTSTTRFQSAVREILLLDPMPTTKDTATFVNRLITLYWDSIFFYSYEFNPLQNFPLRYVDSLNFKTFMKDRNFQINSRVQELQRVLWTIYSVHNGIQ